MQGPGIRGRLCRPCYKTVFLCPHIRAVFFYPEKLECKAKWEVDKHWNTSRIDPLRLKPSAITKQKPDKEKKIRQRNMERARKMGLEYIPQVIN